MRNSLILEDRESNIRQKTPHLGMSIIDRIEMFVGLLANFQQDLLTAANSSQPLLAQCIEHASGLQQSPTVCLTHEYAPLAVLGRVAGMDPYPASTGYKTKQRQYLAKSWRHSHLYFIHTLGNEEVGIFQRIADCLVSLHELAHLGIADAFGSVEIKVHIRVVFFSCLILSERLFFVFEYKVTTSKHLIWGFLHFSTDFAI